MASKIVEKPMIMSHTKNMLCKNYVSINTGQRNVYQGSAEDLELRGVNSTKNLQKLQ